MTQMNSRGPGGSISGAERGRDGAGKGAGTEREARSQDAVMKELNQAGPSALQASGVSEDAGNRDSILIAAEGGLETWGEVALL